MSRSLPSRPCHVLGYRAGRPVQLLRSPSQNSITSIRRTVATNLTEVVPVALCRFQALEAPGSRRLRWRASAPRLVPGRSARQVSERVRRRSWYRRKQTTWSRREALAWCLEPRGKRGGAWSATPSRMVVNRVAASFHVACWTESAGVLNLARDDLSSPAPVMLRTLSSRHATVLGLGTSLVRMSSV